jgi:hypothetical protein
LQNQCRTPSHKKLVSVFALLPSPPVCGPHDMDPRPGSSQGGQRSGSGRIAKHPTTDFVEDFHHQASQELALQALSESPSIAGVAHISQHLHDVCSAASDTALSATPQRGAAPSVSARGLEIYTIKADVSFSTYAFISRVFLVPLRLKNIAQFLEHLAQIPRTTWARIFACVAQAFLKDPLNSLALPDPASLPNHSPNDVPSAGPSGGIPGIQGDHLGHCSLGSGPHVNNCSQRAWPL